MFIFNLRGGLGVEIVQQFPKECDLKKLRGRGGRDLPLLKFRVRSQKKTRGGREQRNL